MRIQLSDPNFEMLILFDSRETRLNALSAIEALLKADYTPDFVDENVEEIARLLKSSLNSDDESESVSASKVLSLIALTGGATHEGLFNAFKSVLTTNVKTSSSFAIRAAGLETLGWLCFLLSSEESETVALLALVHSALAGELVPEDHDSNNGSAKSGEALLRVSALRVWALLATTTPASFVVDSLIPDDVALVADGLNHDDIDVRIASAETLGFVASVVALVEEEQGEDYSPYYFNGYLDVGDVLDSLSRAGATEIGASARKMGKQEKAKQRRGFKGLKEAFESAVSPSSALTIASSEYVFDTWPEITQLNFLREVTDSGFLPHLQQNPILRQIFGLRIGEALVEKRGGNARRDKYRAQSRSANRRDKGARISLPTDE